MKPLVATTLLLALTTLPSVSFGADDQPEIDEATKLEVRDAIQTYVETDLARKEMFFLLDPRADKPLSLTFDHVHSGVYPYEQDTYRACVDFMDSAEILYDVDFAVSIADDEDAVVEKIWLHKVAGQAVQ